MEKEDIEYIKNVLRRGTSSWSGRAECLNRGRRQRPNGKTIKGKDKFLWERNCDICNEWFLLKDEILEVDHIIEIGPFQGDWNKFIEIMYCPQSNLQALCHTCHSRKTSKFNSTLRFTRKNSDAIDSL